MNFVFKSTENYDFYEFIVSKSLYENRLAYHYLLIDFRFRT